MATCVFSMAEPETRRYAMPAGGDRRTWAAWRRRLRARLRQRLGVPRRWPAPAWTMAAPTMHPDYQRRLIIFTGTTDAPVPAWLLVPAAAVRPRPAVIAVHGHGYGMNELVGLTPEGQARPTPQGYHQDFALDLVRQGMVVLVPELRGFGQRRLAEDRQQAAELSSCQVLAGQGLLLERPLLGDRVGDILRALEVLRALPEVDARHIGIMGGSGGGAVALLAAALEPHLRATVICNYFCTFRDSLLRQRHCVCNYVPGLLRDAEMYDIAALIAPRPLLIVSGSTDPLFPLDGARAAFQQVQQAYLALDAIQRLEHDIFAGGHQLRSARAVPFLKRWLAANSEGRTVARGNRSEPA